MKLRAFVGGFTLAAGTAFACVCSAQAADLPMRPAPAPVAPVAYAPPVYNWSGFYIGGHIGGGFENSSWTDPFTGSNDTFNNSGFLGGAQIGVNTQFNWLVLGLEGDFSWTSAIKGTGTDFAGRLNHHKSAMDFDGDRTHRRRVRSSARLRQGRCRVRGR